MACGGDEEPTSTGADASGEDVDRADGSGTTDDIDEGGDVALGDDTSAADASADAESAPDDSGSDAPRGDASGGDLLLSCEDLAFAITCDNTRSNNGYFACSDYFGDTTGVEVQCSANPDVDVRVGGPPCAGYEHYVGSCVYFAEALPDRCYITHVGAMSADTVEAGRAFWRANCAGQWVEEL